MNINFEPLFGIALNKNGETVLIKDAVKGVEYFCPDCGAKFALKKSGNTGPRSRRPHFAHLGHGYNCTPESILHKLFKLQVEKTLSACIENKQEFPIEWDCPQCSKKYSANLVHSAAKVEVEKNLGVCKPDIALLDAVGNVIAVVEVVVTHEPEQEVLDYYKEHGIIMVRVDVHDEDLNNVAAKLAKPSQVSLCTNMACSAINISSQKRTLVKHHTKCKNCGQEYFGVEVSCETAFGTFRLMDFSESEKKILSDIKSQNPGFVWRTAQSQGHEVQILCSPCRCRFIQAPRPRTSNVYYNPFTGKYKKKIRL